MSEIDYFTFDRMLAYFGIGVTIFVAAYIYKIQKNAQRKIDKVIRIFDIIGRARIDWLEHHVGGVLRSLRETYVELNDEVEIYRNNRSRQNLTAIVARAEGARRFRLPQLAALAERDIDMARDYISNPWLIGKFQEVIPLLGWDLDVDETKLTNMDDVELNRYRNNIQDRMMEIQRYIDMIEKEKTIMDHQ